MEPWASVLAGAVPAVVTAVALVFQQRRSNLHALELQELQVLDRRRERNLELVRDAHLSAIHRISAVTHTLSEAGFDLIGKIRDGQEWEPLPGVPLPAGGIVALDQVIDAVGLVCSSESQRACFEAVRAVNALAVAVASDMPDSDHFRETLDAANEALLRYRLAARAEVDALRGLKV